MTTTAAPNASSHVNAAHAASQASRSRAPQGGQGTSPFAQLLQGMADNSEADTAVTAPSSEDAPAKEATEQPQEHGKAHEARRERECAEDTTPQATAQEPATTDLAATVRQAALTAARAKAAGGVDVARAHRAAGQGDVADTARAGAGTSLAHAGAHDAQSATSIALDQPGWQATLDATPVNLAATDPSAGGAAAPDFSLPSLGATASAAPAPAEAPAAAQATLAPPPGSPAFGAALGAQLSTWLQDGVQYATLELNPQDMGPIDVRIALRDGRTEVQLGADVAATRAALNDALPGLADALGDVGLTLTGGSVSDQTGQHARQGEGQPQRGFTLPSWLAPAREDGGNTAADSGRRAQRGLIDLVA